MSWRSSLWCLSAGSLCHANGTLAVLDTTVLDLHCNFPTQALANLTSLSSLVLQFSRSDQVTPPLPSMAHACSCQLFHLCLSRVSTHRSWMRPQDCTCSALLC